MQNTNAGTGHTPGPWMIFDGGDIGSAAVRRPETVVIRSGTVKGETILVAMHNARLIAAAPDLLARLREAAQRYHDANAHLPGSSHDRHCIGDWDSCNSLPCRHAQFAIRRATEGR